MSRLQFTHWCAFLTVGIKPILRLGIIIIRVAVYFDKLGIKAQRRFANLG